MSNSANHFVAGCAGGIAQVLIGQPFDIVKVRLQASSAAQGLENNAWDCFRKIVRYEGGPFALWKGTLPPLMGVGAAVSIQFGVNEKTKYFMKKLTGLSELKIQHLFGCGMVAGLANALVAIPVEHTRIRMQIQGNSSTSLINCVKKIIKANGIGGLYKGGVPTLWRESIAFGIYFSMYEWITRKMLLPNQTKKDLNMADVAFAGGIAGIALWFTTFPIDMIKTKIQADNFQNPIYKGMYDCFVQTYKKSGLRGLYKGLSPCLLRAVPANGATFIVYETASKMLTTKSDLLKKYRFL
jgi:solute carrier family 25 carnitine/acylcarnitine transporter 20/29